jgi:PIN domain nuclease of toxin-antitoxin system
MILLDTHVWLWLNGAVERLSPEALDLLSAPDQELYLSAASAWEIGIKFASGKLTLPAPPSEYVPLRMEDNGIRTLPIRQQHALQAASLPLHHRDPFDRLLIAQAQLENLHLMTVDRHLSLYDVSILWADRAPEAPPRSFDDQPEPPST